MAMFSYMCVRGWIRPSVGMSLYKDILVGFLQGWNHGGGAGAGPQDSRAAPSWVAGSRSRALVEIPRI